MKFQIFLILPILAPLVTGFDLKCANSTVTWDHLVNLTYCNAQSLTLKYPNETISSVNGVTTPTTFQSLEFQRGVVHYLPKGIGQFFPQLKVLKVHSTGLKSLQATDLEGLSNLESLTFSLPAFEGLSSDLFKLTPKLNDVHINKNQISRVGKPESPRIFFYELYCREDVKDALKKQKSSMEGEINEIRAEKDRLGNQLRNEISSLQTRNSQRENELGREIGALKSQKSSLDHEIHKVRTEKDRLGNQLRNEISSLKTKNSQRENELGREIGALKSQKLSMEAEISKLKTEKYSLANQHINEVAALQTKNSQLEAEMEKEKEALKSQQSSQELEIDKLKAETERLKRTCYHGLLNSATKLLHKLIRMLKECRKARGMQEKVGKGVDVVLTVMSATENATTLEMNIESPESKVTKIVDASGNDVQPTQTEIVIDQQNALFLPVNLGQFFPALQRLSLTFSGLYGLDTRTFSGMQNLVAINFTGNKLIEISEDAFAGLANLTELDLSHNNIEFIHAEAFEKNVHLEILRLNHNQLTAIISPIFKHQKKLRMLFLNYNKLNLVNAILLSTLKVLEVVDLRSNECIDLLLPNTTLEEIEARIMDQCIAAVELKCNHEIQGNQTDVTFCQAETLELIFFGTMLSTAITENGDKIQKLSIIDQKMLFMPSQLPETLPNLIQFVVEKSQLKALHKTDFQGLTSLKEITIARNKIALIEEGVFDEVPQITYLNLGYNDIESLPPKAFVKLTKLKTLVLSGNNFFKCTASLLPKKPVIMDFHLRENILEIIDSKVVKMLRNANSIDFCDKSCIHLKYQESGGGKDTTMKDISFCVDFGCDGHSTKFL